MALSQAQLQRLAGRRAQRLQTGQDAMRGNQGDTLNEKPNLPGWLTSPYDINPLDRGMSEDFKGSLSSITGMGSSANQATAQALEARSANQLAKQQADLQAQQERYSQINQYINQLAPAAPNMSGVSQNVDLKTLIQQFQQVMQSGGTGKVSGKAAPLMGGTSSGASSSIAQKTLDVAKANLGLGEPNKVQSWYRNRNGSAYSGNFAWCDAFVSYAYRMAGGKKMPDHAYTPTHVNWFKSKGLWHGGDVSTIRKTTKPGDIIFFNWGGRGGEAQHVGIVDYVDSKGTIHTVEGNRGDTSKKTVAKPGTVIGYGRLPG